MARGSFAEENLYKPNQFEFVSKVGDSKRGEVVAVKSQYVQWKPANSGKNAGVQKDPLTSVVLSLVEIAEDGTHIGEPIDKELVVQWGPSDGSMIIVRPGNAPDRSTDPEDTRDENGNLVLGTEGNTLFIDEGKQFNANTPYITFIRSCKDCAFKKEIIDQAYLQDLLGMQATFALTAGKKNAEFADFVVTAIHRYPYEKKAANKTAASTAPKAASKANGVAKAAPPATQATAPAPAASSEIDEDLSMEVVSILREVFPTITKATSRTKIASSALMAAMKANPPKEPGSKEKIQAIDKILKDRNWFLENLIIMGGDHADVSKPDADMYVAQS